MRTDDNNSNYLIAAEGKVLRRLSDGWVSGSEIYLGYAYQLNGEVLKVPLLELPEHYEEIDDPDLEEIVLLDEATDIIEVMPVPIVEVVKLLPEEPIPTQPKRVTLADYHALEGKVKMMMEMLGVQD